MELPYIEEKKTIVVRKYNPEYGDENERQHYRSQRSKKVYEIQRRGHAQVMHFKREENDEDIKRVQ